MKRMKYAWLACAWAVCTAAQAGLFEDYFRAIELNLGDRVASVLSRGFDPNTLNGQGQTGLYLAMREGAEKAASALLAAPGIDVDKQNQAGETALMMAAIKGRTSWCVRLIEAGAAVNKSGWTPLHYAASGPEVDTVKALLDRSALIDARSPNGTTALMMAARYGSKDSVQLLLQRGANSKLRNDKDLGAADFAKLAGRDQLLPLLPSP